MTSFENPEWHPCASTATTRPPTTPLYVFLPDAPGDLVACRTALAILTRRAHTIGIVDGRLAPLVQDLMGKVLHWRFSKDGSSPLLDQARFAVDLLGSPESSQAIKTNRLLAAGHVSHEPLSDGYIISARWALPWLTPDKSHYSVRQLRVVGDFSEASTWPADWFDAASYPRHEASEQMVALAPGSSIDGAWKRMPSEFWKQLAGRLRARSLRVAWFIGPDEWELADFLVEPSDKAVGLPWDEVLASHGRSVVGVVNDTCHLHIRAHSGVSTVALFNHDEIEEWAGYPKGVKAIDCRGATLDSMIIESMRCIDDVLRSKSSHAVGAHPQLVT